MIIWIIISFLSIVLSILFIAIARTLFIIHQKKGKKSSFYQISSDTNTKDASVHLAKATTFKTVITNESAFFDFQNYLRLTYPLVHSSLKQVYCDTQNLVFIYEGSDKSLLPGLLIAHQDVVPADDEGWIHPPYQGDIKDGFIYGRGSFDDKGSLIAIFEAVEQLLQEQFIPKRTWYLAFGCDEETRGEKGAALLAARMEKENIHFSVVLDEGGAVVNGFFKAIKDPIAAIGLCEKGNVHVQLESFVEGGHSSTPKNPTSVATLAKEIAYIEYHPLKARLTLPIKEMLYNLGIHSPFSFAFILLNTWLFKPIIFSIFKKNPTMNALIRSTVAVTMTKGSDAANIIPTKASAVLNIRLLPDENVEAIIQKYKKRGGITYKVLHQNQSSRISRTDNKEFAHLKTTISSVFPRTIITPYIMTGGSDALHYERVCDNVYRFTPALMDNDELSRMHNINERFSIKNLSFAISFYKTFITQDSF